MLSECPWYHGMCNKSRSFSNKKVFVIYVILTPVPCYRTQEQETPADALWTTMGLPLHRKTILFIYFSVFLVNLHFLCLTSLLYNRAFICQFPIKTNPQTYINVSFSEGFRDSHIHSSPVLLPYLNLGFLVLCFSSHMREGFPSASALSLW